MAQAPEDIKWLYGKLKSKGYDIGSEQEFISSLGNEEDRKWYYDKATGMGLDMGSMDDFNSLYAPALATGQQAAVASPAPSAAAAPVEASAPVGESETAEHERWQPTEQEKIRLMYQMHFGKDEVIPDGVDENGEEKFKVVHTPGLREFNERSRKRVEQARRMVDSSTPEGRDRLKAAKLKAQLMGTPTSVPGLTPGVSGSADDSEQGSTGGEESPKALLSGQSPVPYGVVIENGERKTQWLLPDGSLTTDFVEADKAEYVARRVRLMNQFVGRMKANGLDPSKQDDVQRQAQLDSEAPMRKVLDSVWAQAEDEDRAADDDYRRELEEYNKSFRSNVRGYDSNGMPLPTSDEGLRDLNRAVQRKETFNLESIADKVLDGLPSSYRKQSLYAYEQYFKAHADELKGKTVEKAAEDALCAEVYNAVYERAVNYNMPKSKTEFLIRKIADQPLLSRDMATDMAAAARTGSWGMNAANVDAMGLYGQEHRALDIAGTILNMAVDPLVYASGSLGSLAGKRAMNLAGKYMLKGATKEAAGRFAARTLTGRLIGGSAGGAANIATFEASKNIQGQMAAGGVVNPETGEREFSLAEVVKASAHGLVLGGVTGAVAPILGNVADKYVKPSSSTAGIMGVRTGELAISTLAEGTIFSAYDIYKNSQLADEDPNKRSWGHIWSDSMAMMLGFKVSHMVKSAPAYIRSLRKIQPRVDASGREIPLTQEERNHNSMSFVERLRKRMKMCPRDLDFTKEERDELRRAGYGELADLFTRKEKSKEKSSEPKFEDVADDFPRAENVVDIEEADVMPEPPSEFDGYEAMERLMQDRSVSQAARAKAYFILTGHELPMGTVTGYTKEVKGDGSVIVKSVTADGEVVTSREFANERKAQVEIDNIMRQAELNTIDVGERYAENAISLVVLDEVKDVVAARHRLPAEAVEDIYMKHFKGENLSEAEMEIVKDVDLIASEVAEKYQSLTPAALRENVNERFGVDVDNALRKTNQKRNEAERNAVKEYTTLLFREAMRRRRANAVFNEEYAEMRAEDKENRRRAWRMQMEGKLLDYDPEKQAEADRMYGEGHDVYGRFEQGDPDAQADIDAISRRMEEAYQMCEEVFGEEAELLMYYLNENPWYLINNPEIAPEKQQAAIAYINCKAALDGVLDASHEASQRKREHVKQEVERRTHRERDVIIPAVLKGDDKPVYIVKGDVAMYPDGSDIDTANSSESIIIMDESGEYRFISPDKISRVGDSIDPQVELQTAYARIDAEQEAVFGGGTGSEPDAAGTVRQSVADEPEDYKRGYEGAMEEVSYHDDRALATLIESYSNYRGELNDEERGRLDAFRDEQARRTQARKTQSVPEAVEGAEELGEQGGISADNADSSQGEMAESVTAEENVSASALSRVPVDANGKPDFGAADVDTAWDALVEKTGNESVASAFAANMVSVSEAELKKAEKMKPKATVDIDEFMAAENERLAAVERAKSALEHWKAVAGTKQRREAERLSAEAEEARRRASERAAEEARVRAEREEAARLEREALNGVPDWSVDTPQDARARGYRRNGPQKVDRQEIIDDYAAGNSVEIKFADDVIQRGNVVVMEASQLQPSHRDGQRNPAHFLDEAQPKERKDAASRLAAARIAEGIRPEEITSSVTAYTGAPSVNSRGEVIQGNNRSEALRMMYEGYPDSAARYKRYLIEHAAEFGLTREAVEAFEHPVLVNMLDVSDERAIALGQYVAQDTESGGVERIKPKNAVQKMGDKIGTFANLLLRSADEEATFAQLVDANGINVLKWMNRNGYITNTQYASAFDSKGNLTAEAANDLKGIMYQSVFRGGSTRLEEMFNNLPSKAQRAILATAFRDYDSAFADRMIGEIQQSVIAFNALIGYERFRDATNAESARQAVGEWVSQYAFDDVSGEPYLPSETFSNFALALAAMYKGNTQKHIQSVFNTMYDIVQGTEQDNLFEAADKTPRPVAEAIRQVLNLEYQPVKKNDNGTNGSAVLDINSEDVQDGRRGSNGNADGAEQSEGGTGPADSGAGTESDSGRGGNVAKPSFMEAVKALYEKGKDFAVKLYQRTFFDVVKTPDFMKELGLTGDKFTIRFGVISRHFGKDSDHKLPLDVWEQLPDAILTPFAITRHFERKRKGEKVEEKGYRIYTTLRHNDKYVIVGADVKVAGKGIEINAIETAFAITSPSELEEIIYTSKNITPDQQALLDGRNSRQYPAEREFSDDKGNTSSSEKQADSAESSLGVRVKAAEAEVNTDPTPGQKEAGNYKKGHVQVGTFDVTIEQPVGSVRRGTDADGKEWETTMLNTYGYIRGTEGVDGDHIDVFLSDTPEEGDVFVVDQVNEDGSFDEHKVMYGFPTEQAARDAYLSNYKSGWNGLGAITRVSKEEFKKWIQSSKRKTKPFAEYKSVRDITYNVDQTPTNVNEQGMIVDGEGKPLTLYHGTPNDVELADLAMGHTRQGDDEAARYNGDGISFTPNRDVANDYATTNGGEGKVFEVNVTLKKPYYTLGIANFTPEEAAEFTASLQAKGHDGIINYQSKAMREAGAIPNEVIVFDVNSATPATGVAPANVSSEQPSQGNKAYGIASNQSVINSDGKVSDSAADKQAYEAESSDFERELADFARRYGAGKERVSVLDREFSEWMSGRSVEELADLDVNMLNAVCNAAGLDAGNAWAFRMSIDKATPKEKLSEVFELRGQRKAGEMKGNEEAEGDVRFHTETSGNSRGDSEVYEAAKGLLESAGIEVVEVDNATAQEKLGGHDDVRLMGSRTDRKMSQVGEYYSGKELDGNQQSVVDVFSGKEDNVAIDVERVEGTARVVMRQGTENRAGAKHSLFRHFGTRAAWVTEADIAMIPEIIGKGERSVVGKKISYDYVAEDGSRLRVTTEKHGESEVFTNFLSDRKPLQEKSVKDTQLSARRSDAEVSDAKLGNNSESGKSDDSVRVLRTSGGVVYGWTEGGKVYLNRDAMNPETPLHEYTHLWDDMVRRENPELWARGKELMKQTPLWDEVVNDPAYADIRDDEDAVASEVHSRLTGKHGADVMQEMINRAKAKGAMETAEAVSLVERLKRWLGDMFRTLRATLGKWSKKELDGLTLEDFNNMTLRDLAEGVNPKSGEKNLVAVHNISEENLIKALDLGGFPMPSVAITKAGTGHTGFGEISLVFGKESVNPADRRNKVYSGDAWTPTYPETGYKLNEAKTARIYDRANNAGRLPFLRAVDFHPDNYGRKISDDRRSLMNAFREDYGAKQLFLSEHGNAVESFETREVEKYTAEETGLFEKMLEQIGVERLRNESVEELFAELSQLIGAHNGTDLSSKKPFVAASIVKNAVRKALDYADNGNIKTEKDLEATRAKIDERLNPDEYEAWLEDMFADIVEKKGIRNERDMFTPSGESRRWESLYDAVTLDNVVKAMRRQADKGGTGFFGGSIFGAAHRELKNMEDIRREAAARIRSVSDEEIETAKKRVEERLGSISLPSVEGNFSATMDFVENVREAVVKSHTAEGIYRYLSDIYPDMTMDVAKEISDIVGEIQQMSTRYLEAKPQRAVTPEEVRLAVVPEGTPAEIVKRLESFGIAVRTYERGNEHERNAIISRETSERDLRFHAAMSRGRGDFDAIRERAVSERGIVMPGLNEAEVRVVEVPRHDFAGTGKEALTAAEKWGKENITGMHTAFDSEGNAFEYSISNDAVEKYVSRSATAKSENIGVHLAVLKKLPEIISESIEAEVHPDYKKSGGKRAASGEVNAESLVHRFYGAVIIEDKPYRVKTTMREFSDENMSTVAHSYEVIEIELLEAPSDNTIGTAEPLAMTSNSSIPAAKLLQGVEKSYDPGKKLLDESEIAYREDNLTNEVTAFTERFNSSPLVIVHGAADIERDGLSPHSVTNLKEFMESGECPAAYCIENKKISLLSTKNGRG